MRECWVPANPESPAFGVTLTTFGRLPEVSATTTVCEFEVLAAKPEPPL